MDREPTRSRRSVVSAAAGVAALGTTAGCLGAGTGTETTPDSSDDEDERYTVSFEPMGAVEFEAVPQTWVANNGSWADMGIALGLEPPEAVWMTSRYHTQYYEEIPDLDVDTSDMTSLYQDGVDKERFYDLDGDVHVLDPNFLMNRFNGWSESDVADVEAIAPLFGNAIFSRGYPWHEDYRYYTLYEAFEKLAAVFQRRERYEAFAELHEEFQAEIAEIVPPESERPDVAIFWASGDEPEEFLPYVINDGTSFKQWNDLRVRDALANSDVRDFHSSRGAVDYETLLEVDPEVILLRGQETKTAAEFRDTVVSYFRDHEIASQLTAVRNARIYQAGPLYQGPIFNLVLTERAAGQIYDVDRSLFDRGRVGAIVSGDV